MEPKFFPEALRTTGVALLFAICGALSSFCMNAHSPDEGSLLAVPLPFAVLLFFLLLAPKAAWLLTVPLNVGTWLVAYWITIFMMVNICGPLLSMFIGGLAGSLGVTLCTAMGYPLLLRSTKYLTSAAAIGGVCALPFGFWWLSRSTGEYNLLTSIYFRCAFAIWQAAVGTYLYVVCRELRKSPPDDSQQAPSS
jgi:hypothetical protein